MQFRSLRLWIADRLLDGSKLLFNTARWFEPDDTPPPFKDEAESGSEGLIPDGSEILPVAHLSEEARSMLAEPKKPKAYKPPPPELKGSIEERKRRVRGDWDEVG